MHYPYVFRPILKERVWGGRLLESLYHKTLPPTRPIGESWEVSDRPGEASEIVNGPLAGKDLRWLMERYAGEILGPAPSWQGRFPLLVKILDAREKLSLQVHPPAAKARELGGDPKTEMWYIAHAEPGAELYAGLRGGVSRLDFERELAAGSVEGCFHRLAVHTGDALFLPSGRVHALGAGLVVFEIQQNSDTTYRVSDWHRLGLDGKPRELHVAESLASIDFNDFEPRLIQPQPRTDGVTTVSPLVRDRLFSVELRAVRTGGSWLPPAGTMLILGVLTGRLEVVTPSTKVALEPGSFSLLPACLGEVQLRAESGTSFLQTEAGSG